MKVYVDKAKLQEFTTKLTAKYKTMFEEKGGGGGSSIAITNKVLKGDGNGNAVEAVENTDYQTPVPFKTTPTTNNKVLTEADVTIPTVPTIASSGMLKGDGNGNAVAATAGTDYQAAITASGILKGNGSGGVSAATSGTDYQAPLSFITTPTSSNQVLTKSEAGMHVQSYTSGTSATVSGTINANNALMYNPATARTSVTATLGTPKGTSYTTEWQLGFKAGASCSVTITPPSGYTIVWKDGVPTWTSGNYYEISFMKNGNYIFAVVAEISMS